MGRDSRHKGYVNEAREMRAQIILDPAAARERVGPALVRSGGHLPEAAALLNISHRMIARVVEELGLSGVLEQARRPTHRCACGRPRAEHDGRAPYACRASGCRGFAGTGGSTRVRRATCTECDGDLFSSGFCRRHYYARWRAARKAAG